MKKTWLSAGQVLLTLIVVIVAGLVLWRIINYYMFSPWTRDGHVRADVIQVAPDVSGLITSVQVADNQEVKRGQVLFVIDQARYTLAERLAEATLAQRRATLAQAKREYARNLQLGNLVASEQVEESRTRVEQGEASVADAQVSLDTAKLNLQRTTIVSPVDGYLNDRAPAPANTCRPAARCCRWSTATRSASTATSRKPSCAASISGSRSTSS